METLVGFAVGFLVGTKEGKEGRDKILQSWPQSRSRVSSNGLLTVPWGLRCLSPRT